MTTNKNKQSDDHGYNVVVKYHHYVAMGITGDQALYMADMDAQRSE